MDQFVLFNYVTKINDRVVRIVCEPGTPWEDVYKGVDEIIQAMKVVQQEIEKKEKERQEQEQIRPLELLA